MVHSLFPLDSGSSFANVVAADNGEDGYEEAVAVDGEGVEAVAGEMSGVVVVKARLNGDFKSVAAVDLRPSSATGFGDVSAVPVVFSSEIGMNFVMEGLAFADDISMGESGNMEYCVVWGEIGVAPVCNLCVEDGDSIFVQPLGEMSLDGTSSKRICARYEEPFHREYSCAAADGESEDAKTRW